MEFERAAGPRPGSWRFVVGGLVIAAGVAGFIAFLLTRLAGFSDALVRVTVPGSGELNLQAGAYTVYWERENLFESWPGLRCALAFKDSGKRIELSETWVTSRYSFAGKRGTSLFRFQAAEPGVYVLSADHPDGRSGGTTTLAVGPSGMAGIVLTVLGCIGILGGSIAAGVLLIVRTARRRAA